jgi:DNA-binding transcriptional regulator YiaG
MFTAADLRLALRDLKMKQRAFARHIDYSPEQVNRWTRGKKPIPTWVEHVVSQLRTEQESDAN